MAHSVLVSLYVAYAAKCFLSYNVWLPNLSRFDIMSLMKELTNIVKSKSDPRYKLYVSGCLTKKCFDSKDDVIAFLDMKGFSKNPRNNLYAYKCKFCNGWHFSSEKMYAPDRLKAFLNKSELVVNRSQKQLPRSAKTSVRKGCHKSWEWEKTKLFLENLLRTDVNKSLT